MKHKQTMYRAILVLAGILVIGLLTVWVLPQAGSGQGITTVTLPAGIVYADETAPDVYLPLVITSDGKITTTVQTLSMFSVGDNYAQAVTGPPYLSYTNKSFVASHDPQIETIYAIGRSALVAEVPDFAGKLVSASLIFSDCVRIINNLPAGTGLLHVGTWLGNGLPSASAGWSAYDQTQVVGQIPFTACPAAGQGQATIVLNPQFIHAGQPLRLLFRDSEDGQALTPVNGQDTTRSLAAYQVYLVLEVQ